MTPRKPLRCLHCGRPVRIREFGAVRWQREGEYLKGLYPVCRPCMTDPEMRKLPNFRKEVAH